MGCVEFWSGRYASLNQAPPTTHSSYGRRSLTIEAKKLRLVVETAREVWA
jgi:hypothetical protein